jgi:TonB-linked SusC/RagA family outer membrane protein
VIIYKKDVMFKINKYKIIAASIVLFTNSVVIPVKSTAQDFVKTANFPDRLPFQSETYELLFHGRNDSAVIGAISYLKGKYLESTPANYIGHAMTGRLSGLLTVQQSGQPGADNVSFNLRGRAPVVYIDGIPRPSTMINPEQIESVTLLKDALSANMMGIRSTNGAILITTKKGVMGKNYFQMNATAQTGVQTPLKVREYLSAADYATLYNEALINDGRAPVYSTDDITLYRNGSRSFTHPNVNWNDVLLKKNSSYSRYTIGAEGGSKTLSYAMSLDYMDQNGMLKENNANTYNTNSAFERYIFRTNITSNITDNIGIFLNLFGRIRVTNDPGEGVESIMNAINLTPNNAYPVFNPNGSFSGNVNYVNNLYAQSTATGYQKRNLRDGFADAGFNAKLDHVLKGWWVKGLVSFNTAVDQTINRTKDYEVYQMSLGQANDTTYQRFGVETAQTNSSTIDVSSRQVYLQLTSGWQRQVGIHSFDVLMTAYSDKSTSNQELSNTFNTAASKIGYNLLGKYSAELSVAYSTNNRFIKGKQGGFFPAAGMGWDLHKEGLFKKVRFIDLFRIRTTYGLTANANPGYFLFQENYSTTGSYIFGATPGSATGLAITTMPSVRTYEKGNKLNVGMELSLFKRHFYLSADYYLHHLTDLLISRGASNALLGLTYPLENLGKYDYSGIELNTGYSGRVGRHLLFDLSANLTTQQSKVVYNDEQNVPYPWMRATGLPVGMVRGYVSDGFVSTAGQGPVLEGYQSRPGDLRYKDLNNDGVINFYDRTAIGTDKAKVFYGINLNLRWNKFYAGILLQGVSNNQLTLTGNDVWEFQSAGLGQAYPHHLDRWTPQTAAVATYPRLTVGTNPNNHVLSSYWLTNGDFLRLKNFELGYQFSGGILSRAKLSGLRVFANGMNLFTLSRFKTFDPEMPGANYSVQKVINGGCSVSF